MDAKVIIAFKDTEVQRKQYDLIIDKCSLRYLACSETKQTQRINQHSKLKERRQTDNVLTKTYKQFQSHIRIFGSCSKLWHIEYGNNVLLVTIL